MNNSSNPGGEAGSAGSYALGHSERELERLSIQARLVDPITRRFFVEAGIAPGMRVLDIGSGAGDVVLLAAELVGAEGEVVGTDRSATALAVAKERTDSRSLRNVSFLVGDPSEMTFERPFDAIIGRYVLMFQRDPGAMLRKLKAHVRTGGVVVFHEPDRKGIRSFPPVAAFDRACEMIDETFQQSGTDPRTGLNLYKAFVTAGLPAPLMRSEAVIGGGVNSSDQVHYEMDVARTLSPEMERLGVVKPGEIDFETLADRVLAEVIANHSVIMGRTEIGVWSRL